MAVEKGTGRNRSQRLAVRRARRWDYEAIAVLVGLPESDTERPVRKRFRKLVSSLVEDFYVAEERGELYGTVLVAYVREVDGGSTALVRDLRLSGRRVAETLDLLASCIDHRARVRGARRIEIGAGAVANNEEIVDGLVKRGYLVSGQVLVRPLVGDSSDKC